MARLTGTKHSILWECDRYISALREIKAGIPPSVEQCVARCRRKDSAQRFQTMSGAKLRQFRNNSAIVTFFTLATGFLVPGSCACAPRQLKRCQKTDGRGHAETFETVRLTSMRWNLPCCPRASG